MPKPRVNILRSMRLQIKSGFLKREPDEYAVMKRSPPMAARMDFSRRVKKVNVPYARLYEKAKERNTLFDQEAVFDAYGHQAPQGLTMAKRQYQYIQEGMSEEEAYIKALQYVNEVENEAYVNLKRAIASVKATGTDSPYMADPDVADEMAMWKEILEGTSYNRLPLEQQGALDMFLQKRVLRWTETERERRMTDIIFHEQFETLLNTLFPGPEEIAETRKAQRLAELKADYLQSKGLDMEHLSTAKPFYIEDYLALYEKVKAQPEIRKWSVAEREELSRFVVESLVYGSGLINKSAEDMQDYLDSVKERFFPMIRMPFWNKFPSPTVMDVKRALYTNEIGYKQENDKTFVKRFYRIPKLLFPAELMMVQAISNSSIMQEIILSDSDAEAKKAIAKSLKMFMKEYGVPANRLGEMVELFDQMMQQEDVEEETNEFEMEDEFSSGELSVLDEILDTQPAKAKTARAEETGAVKDVWDLLVPTPSAAISQKPRTSVVSIESIVAEVQAEGDDEEEEEEEEEEDKEVPLLDKFKDASPEWKAMVNKHYPFPQNEYDHEKLAFYDLSDYSGGLEHIKDEEDAMSFAQSRMQSEAVLKAKLTKIFDEKERARIHQLQTGGAHKEGSIWQDDQLTMISSPMDGNKRNG